MVCFVKFKSKVYLLTLERFSQEELTHYLQNAIQAITTTTSPTSVRGTIAAKVDRSFFPNPQLSQFPGKTFRPNVGLIRSTRNTLPGPSSQNLHRERSWPAVVVSVPAARFGALHRPQEPREVLQPQIDPPDLALTLPRPGVGRRLSPASIRPRRSALVAHVVQQGIERRFPSF